MTTGKADRSNHPTPESSDDPGLPFLLAFFRAGTWMLVIGSVLLSIALVALDQSFRVAIAAPFPAFGLSALWLARTGRVRAAFRLVLYGVWLATLLALWTLNGVHGPSVSILAVILLLAGWQVGPRATVVMTAVTAVSLLVMAYAAENNRPVPVRVIATSYYAGAIHAVVMTAAGMLGYYMHRALDGQLEALRTSRAELSDKVLELSASEAELLRRDSEVRELNRGLEKRVAERTAELQSAVEDLRSFSYSVSHDLRGPLRTINGYAHALFEDEGKHLSEDGVRQVRVIERNARRMSELIDGLLELARVGRVPVERQPLDMGAIAKSALEDIRGQYPNSEVLIEPLPQAEGDPTLITRVFANLLGNALKYSAGRDRPEVHVGWSDAERAWYVRDNGVGFDDAHADHLFGTFHRLHSADEFEGTGIGLAIVKSIVERHGGHVHGRGVGGEGATFYFSLREEDATAPEIAPLTA